MSIITRAARVDEITPIITSLEQSLKQLDVLDNTIAAAHVDSAIHQLRRDQKRVSECL